LLYALGSSSAVAVTAPDTPVETRASWPVLVPLIVACALFMQSLDSTVIATALPTIAHALGESPLRLNVAITCYLLSLAVFIPISGWVADWLGARRVFSGAIVVFTLGSIGCGFALTGIGLATLAFGFENVGRGALTAMAVVALLAVGIVFMVFYVRHASRVPHPIIDLALMKIPTYASATIGGFLFRMGLGALPFLLPLMLQVGFGLTALSSGLLTFASAAGAMTMKITAPKIIRTLGFRIVLVGDAVISAGFLFTYSLFRPNTPHLVIFLALLAGGFFLSLQITSINTLSYADVPPAMLSRATSLTSMAQQLSQTVGVATGALLLQLMLVFRGHTALTAADFYPAFIGVAMISLLSVPFFLRMAPDAGAEVSGQSVAR
jgi:MFS family permease